MPRSNHLTPLDGPQTPEDCPHCELLEFYERLQYMGITGADIVDDILCSLGDFIAKCPEADEREGILQNLGSRVRKRCVATVTRNHASRTFSKHLS